MKKSKFIPVLAFLFAIIGVVATQASAPLLGAFYQQNNNPGTPLDETACVSGTVNEGDCPEANGTVNCTITVPTGQYQAGQVRDAFQNDTDPTCEAPILVRIP